jgi:hypothetical protein
MNVDIIRRAFGNREFTVSEAAWALGLTRAGGTLSRLKTRGFVVQAGPGRYRLAPPASPEALKARLASERIRELFEGPVPLALDGPDAVAIWTAGRYHPPRHPGPPLVHLACAARDLPAASAALATLGIPWAPPGEWPPGRSLKAIVRTLPTLRPVFRGGQPVVPRREVLRLIKADPAAYEGAEEWVTR